MATEFSRLYRELCHSDPHSVTKDITFLRERKQILKTVGYTTTTSSSSKQSYKEPEVSLNKHHGKAARRRISEARLKAISINSSESLAKQREIQELTVKTQQVNNVTTQIQKLMSNNSYVSQNLWSKYDKIYGITSTSTSTSSKQQHQHSSRNNSPTKPYIASPTIPRSTSLIRCDYSKNKWTKEERSKLNSLYHQLKRPPVNVKNNEDAWDAYLQEFSSTFRIFFPHRTQDEVISKIKSYLWKKHFVEPGEEVYWKDKLKKIENV